MIITIACPVLGRPHRVASWLSSLAESQATFELRPLFIVSGDDKEELEVIKHSYVDYLVADWPAEDGDFARKINFAVRETDSEWFLAGADDLSFQPGWADIAIKIANENQKRFVATNDRANPLVMRGRHATHPLVHRSYLEWGTIDEPGKLYCEIYSHQCCDNEATATAMARNEFVFAQMAIVEHHHPIYPRKGIKTEMDDTYRKGMAKGQDDIRIFRSREHLWSEENLHINA